MAQYAIIENGIITGLRDDIPMSWGNEVSGFHHLTDKEREKWGFFKVTQADKTEYDPSIHDVTLDEHKIVKGRPVHIFKYDARYTDEELLTIRKEVFWRTVRSYRDMKLSQSDWAFMSDVLKARGDSWYTAWAEYRQKLRDITLDESLFGTVEPTFVELEKVFPPEPKL